MRAHRNNLLLTLVHFVQLLTDLREVFSGQLVNEVPPPGGEPKWEKIDSRCRRLSLAGTIASRFLDEFLLLLSRKEREVETRSKNLSRARVNSDGPEGGLGWRR